MSMIFIANTPPMTSQSSRGSNAASRVVCAVIVDLRFCSADIWAEQSERPSAVDKHGAEEGEEQQ